MDGKERGGDKSSHKKSKKERSLLERASSEEDLLAEPTKAKKSSAATRLSKKLPMLSSGHKDKSQQRDKSARSQARGHDRDRAGGHGRGQAVGVCNDAATVAPAAGADGDMAEAERLAGGASSVDASLPQGRPVFAVCVDDALAAADGGDQVPVPLVVRLCIDYVEERGLCQPGLYRVSPVKSRLEQLRRLADAHRPLELCDAHEAAALLKLWLRELPEHVLTDALWPRFQKVADACPCAMSQPCTCLNGDRIKALLMQLPRCNYVLCGYLLQHARRVSEMEAHNKMSLANLGMVLHVTLRMQPNLVNILLRNTGASLKEATKLFDDIQIKRLPSSSSVDRSGDDDLPNHSSMTEVELREELSCATAALAELHGRLAQLGEKSSSDERADLEQQLWDTQRRITSAKRTLKAKCAGSTAAVASPPGDTAQTTVAVEKSTTPAPSGHGGSGGPCVEMFEEKQLLAVHSSLADDVAMERRAVLRLLRQVHARLAYAPQLVADTGAGAPVAADDEQMYWKREYDMELLRHEQLLKELISERASVARLRAEIELALVRRTAAADFGSAAASPQHTPRHTAATAVVTL